MFCSISGEVPQDPVISKVSGHLYERRLIEKYIKDNGKCPVTGNDLNEEDLLSVKANKAVRPRPIATLTVPGLLQALQNEWDELMLETFTLKQSLDTTRQELSQALYQHDAACRVIARLMRERDEAKAALVTLEASGLKVSNGQPPRKSTAEDARATESANMEVELSANGSGPLDGSVLTTINDTCAALSSSRKGRKPVAEGALAKDKLASFGIADSFTPHKANQGAIQAISLSPDPEGSYILTGGADKDGIVTSRQNGKAAAKLSGHKKKITDVSFHPKSANTMFTASADKTVKIWNNPGEDFSEASSALKLDAITTFTSHDADVTSITVHPTGQFLGSCSLDKSWCFLDANAGQCLRKIGSDDEYLCCRFHPDGLILGTGSATAASAVKIWDIREQANAATFDSHTAAVKSLAFSENGYYMASGCEDNMLRLWDLRKLKSIQTLNVGVPAQAIAFDPSGLYLAVEAADESEKGNHLQIIFVKDFSVVKTLSGVHSKSLSGMAWGPSSSFLATASQDRVVRILKPSD